MCGIVACRGREDAIGFLLKGLGRLEYRGYDSAGVAVAGIDRPELRLLRTVGRVSALEGRVGAQRPHPDLGVGIGHSRWATHGGVSEANAHPHSDCGGRIAVVHNGIIDNADELRRELLARGHRIASEVDTEVVVHLIEESFDRGSLVSATAAAVARLRGTWALAITAAGVGQVVLASHRSPLLLGTARTGHYAASDVTALVGVVESVSVLEDGDIVCLDDEVRWYDNSGRATSGRPATPVTWASEDVDRGGYDDYMEKEIAEQPAVVGHLLETLLPQVADGTLWRETGLSTISRLRFVACGTSFHASQVIGRVFGKLSGIPAECIIASEYDEIVETRENNGLLTVAVSQSGETSDILHALQDACGPVLAITNRPQSSLGRRADAVLDCCAGPEIGVAATKTFTSQIVAGIALALSHAAATGALPAPSVAEHLLSLASLPGRLDAAAITSSIVSAALAHELAQSRQFFFVSRGAGLPYAAEGALKLKEISYLSAEALPAGEFKHGPIALIDEGTPVIVIESGSATRLSGAMAELTARGARIIRIGKDADCTYSVLPRHDSPWGPIEGVVAFQHLARSIAVALGRDADKPRNLAKSVTVL